MEKIAFAEQWQYSKNNGEKRLVTLPHDAMIEEKREPGCASGTGNGFFPGGVYVYEKEFDVPADWAGKTAMLEFEGVYRNAKVYVNGQEAGGKPYGYIPFYVDMTPYLAVGKTNIVRVEADNSKIPNSRWYSGGGIYRPVWLHLGNASHIQPDGIRITTLDYEPARIKVETTHTGGEVTVEVLDKASAVIASGKGDKMELEIPNAALWSDESPALYSCRVTLEENGAKADEVVESFGIRKVEWSTKGLFVNGKETLLRGGCIHHDNGILGARCYREAEERRVRILKKAGYNAIRSAHNPISKAMIEACDRLGVYVMDETWDMWYKTKNDEDYALDFPAHWKYDVEALISRDYNHPSVIMYSIGNEVSEPHGEKGLATEKEIMEHVRRYDSTRPITCGINMMILYGASLGVNVADSESTGFEQPIPTDSTSFNEIVSSLSGMLMDVDKDEIDTATSPCLDMLDIAGYNYASPRYAIEGEKHPERIIVGSETFPMDIGKNWDMVKKYPYLIGDFMWTAWDYLGEVGLGAWAYSEDAIASSKQYPWLLADTGAIDILGNVGAQSEYASVVWGARGTPYLGVQPVNHPGVVPAKHMWRGTNAIASWAWHGCEGNEAVVEVYANAAEVELLLNGESLGRQAIESYKAEFTTVYQPGLLEAVAYDTSGKQLSRTKLHTPEGLPALKAVAEKAQAKPGELVYVNVTVAYADGTVESNMDTKVNVSVEGGELLAFGSANPRTEERFLDGSYATYYGRALAVVRCGAGGTVSVKAKAVGYADAMANIQVLAQ